MKVIKRTCASCGKDLFRRASRKTTRSFCDMRCKGDWQKQGLLGEANPHWRGGRIIERDGYVQLYIPSHHRAGSNGYVYEHIIVMEGHVGIQIERTAQIHHLNGDRADNRIANLVLVSGNNHPRNTVRHLLQLRVADLERELIRHSIPLPPVRDQHLPSASDNSSDMKELVNA